MCTRRFAVLGLSGVVLAALASTGWAGPGDPVKGVKVSCINHLTDDVAPVLNSSPVLQSDGSWVADSTFDFNYEIDFDSAAGPVTLTGPGTGHLAGTAPDVGGAPGLFNAEMLSLDLSGGPFFTLRESPTLPSDGPMQINSDPADGTYRIDSFFDIFTELSLDGGQTWTPTDPSAWQFSVAPEPSSFVLAGLAAAGFIALARRKR